MWKIVEENFNPEKLLHKETVFTIGNGYLSTRGAFEEGYPGDGRATFVHGLFDDVPLVFTELANAPDWLPLQIYLNEERFALDRGEIEQFERHLDMQSGLLIRTVRWRSPSGDSATLMFERFASMDDEHLLCLRCRVIPDFEGRLEIRSSLNGYKDNEGFLHWYWVDQGMEDGVWYLHTRTRGTGIDLGMAMSLRSSPDADKFEYWDAQNVPTLSYSFMAKRGEAITLEKIVGIATSRDTEQPVRMAVEHARSIQSWNSAFEANRQAWAREWERCDVEIEGDDEAQLAIRFNLFQLLIAAPRHDPHVNIGAKTLSGFGYHGHSFWDTEIFMLPLFIYTAPHIARNLLDYRYERLPGARQKAQANGFEGAQFPWESADTGDEVTPTWVPHYADRTKHIRIWTGDIEIHISADIAYAARLYWKITEDDDWFIEKGAELVLDTAKFWASRAEWNSETGMYQFTDVIGPDEYHDHVDNNFFTNRMAQWNLQSALDVLDWLRSNAPSKADELTQRLGLSRERLAQWKEVSTRIFLPLRSDGLIEQFEGYFQRRDVDLAALEPRDISAQVLFGIEGCNETQVIKQPDVLMLLYLLRDEFTDEQVLINYDYYTPRTDHTYGSSLGPSIQAIMACDVNKSDDAYEHFIRAVRADLRDVRNNAGDGIHGASAGGTWQAVVFGFGGLCVTSQGWSTQPRLPAHWKRLTFRFLFRGKIQVVEITKPETSLQTVESD
ncbi:MAG TPA: glycoside hydrolase family 65 protein [Anaerolineales bacterium]|nr:glycoside hydrolase family 65 protein [Anaerolineales bacterium]